MIKPYFDMESSEYKTFFQKWDSEFLDWRSI